MPAPTDKRQRHAVCVCVSLAGVGAQRLGGSHERRARRSGRGPAGRRSRDLPLQTERRPARRPLSLSLSVSLSLGFLRPKPRLPCVSFAARRWPPIIWRPLKATQTAFPCVVAGRQRPPEVKRARAKVSSAGSRQSISGGVSPIPIDRVVSQPLQSAFSPLCFFFPPRELRWPCRPT